MKVYYAHCIALYNTPQELRDISLLEQIGLRVVNPNTPECSEGYKAHGMDYFKQFAESCDVIAFRALPDGAIPAGVATEIEMFRAMEKPVIELPTAVAKRTIGVGVTREYLKECGFR